MKKILSIFLSLCMIFAMLPVSVSAAPIGTAITSAEEFADMTGTGTYYLANDIEITATYTNDFRGTFDGNGYTINTSKPLLNSIGLGGTVKNLKVTGDITSSTLSYVGGVAGQNSGTIKNCIVTANISATSNGIMMLVGGITGNNGGTIENCYTTGNISGTGNHNPCYAGGIAGMSGGTVRYCYSYNNSVSATGNYTSLNSACGGIVGYGSNVNNCVALNNSISVIGGTVQQPHRVVGNGTLPPTAINFGIVNMTGGTNSIDAFSVDGADVIPAMVDSLAWWTAAPNWTMKVLSEAEEANENNPWVWDDLMGLPKLKWEVVLTGTPTISNTAPRIGSVLNGSLEGGNNTGTLTYTWKAAGTQVSTGSSYTATLADLGKEITLEIESSVQPGTVTSAPTAAVAKKVAPSAPEAPTLVSKTYNTVTLTANADYQFSKDGSTWQTSNVFSGLSENTAYTFYQRVAETADTESSPASSELSVTTDTAPVGALTGVATIGNTSPRIGSVLNGSLEGGNNTGALTYTWKSAGTQVSTGSSYTATLADLGNEITLEIESNVETGTVTSAPTTAVAKKAAPSAPEAPMLVSKTNNTVTLTPNSDYQFSKDGTTWQTSNVFSGLSPNTAYTFYQRIAETADTESSTASMGFSVTTNSNGGSGSGGGSSTDNSYTDNSSQVIVTPPTPDNPNSPTQGEIKVLGIVDGNGNVTVNITDKTVVDAFEKALANAKKNGNEQNGIIVVLRVDTGSNNGSKVTVNLPKTVQDTILANKIINTIVVVDNPDIVIDMDLDAVREINSQAYSDVNITAIRTGSDKLNEEARRAIGPRPVFNLKVNYGSRQQVQNFGTGSVSVAIPYTLGENEKAENVKAVYVDENGKVYWLENSVYDSVEKVLRFSTNHFSSYGVGYKQDITQLNTAFTDIEGHWAKEDIEFVTRHGLFSGTSETTFSPNTAMTRGMFVTAIGRLANADVSGYEKSSFTDVKSDAYYIGYIEWANKNGIVSGIGNESFAPDQSITREQMAVIMQNYAKVIDFTLPKLQVENTFEDSTKISTYAKDAVNQMQTAGIISGKNGNLFDPQGTATRAEVSAVLCRFVKIEISSATAQD